MSRTTGARKCTTLSAARGTTSSFVSVLIPVRYELAETAQADLCQWNATDWDRTVLDAPNALALKHRNEGEQRANTSGMNEIESGRNQRMPGIGEKTHLPGILT